MIDQVARGPWLRKPADDRINDTFAEPSRHPAISVPDAYAEVTPVSAEKLITAQAGQRYLDEAGCRLTHVVAWNHGIVSKRLIEGCHDILDDVRDAGFDIDLVVVETIALRNHACVDAFVYERRAGIRKSHGKGLDRPVGGGGHHRDHEPAVDAAGQKGSHRDVAHEMRFHRSLQSGLHAPNPLGRCSGDHFRIRHLPVAARAHFSLWSDGDGRAGRNLGDGPIYGPWC